MRLPGWCTECHRIRQVRVSGSDLVRLAVGGVSQGICADCEDGPKCTRCGRRPPTPGYLLCAVCAERGGNV